MNKYVLGLLKCKNVGNVKLLNYLKNNDFDEKKIRDNIDTLISKEDSREFDFILQKAEDEIKLNEKFGIKMISIFDKDFPKKLWCIKDPVLYLYYKGNISLLNRKSLAIIGSRDIPEDDFKVAQKLAKSFSNKGICIVSGLAIGSDTAAHEGAVTETGSTVAILPAGLDKIVPSSNKLLAERILEKDGLLVSEYGVGTIPTKFTFVKRDRIQAALSDAVLVIKANEKSGTMNAVRCALESGKYVTQLSNNGNKDIPHNYNMNNESEEELIKEIYNHEIIQDDYENYKQESLF